MRVKAMLKQCFDFIDSIKLTLRPYLSTHSSNPQIRSIDGRGLSDFFNIMLIL